MEPTRYVLIGLAILLALAAVVFYADVELLARYLRSWEGGDPEGVLGGYGVTPS